MNIDIRKSFQKDALKLSQVNRSELAELISKVSSAKKLSEITSCKKLSGFKNAYRIRMGSYRLGFFFENETIEFVRILDRKNIYRHFP